MFKLSIVVLAFSSAIGIAASPSWQVVNQPLQITASPELRGVWRGRYANFDAAELTVDRQDGPKFSGTISITTKAGKDPLQLQIEGNISEQNVEIREVSILTLGAVGSWRLGTGSGLLRPDGKQMIGIGKDAKSSYGWDFTRLTTSVDVLDAPTLLDLRGNWDGTYSGLPAQLTIDAQDGSTFSGTLVLSAKRGKPMSEVEIEGSVSGNTIEIRETRLLKIGAADGWNLGVCSGTVRPGAQQMSGAGKDRDGAYRWSFSRR